ncbi:hypothetical protein GGI59_001459 [Rhizobium lentis]|uniref:Uncharacterized protein n=1 Tax=Rhizobium lentis TaxID=1138194 RepID=A0A7W8UKT1_9HYPH|nr:hypothetical protein [Rhizobium lentis]MBB5549282.1 hypothetical protein [Rhizobium lentis]MBB5559816.1 hypothetical protein [Rhizobium lentis]MBB5566301.1 hypothetical protein [Rhizobium lentis]
MAPMVWGGMDPRVKPEDDGVWGDFWSKNSEEPGRGCDFDVGFSTQSSALRGALMTAS